MSRAPAPAPAPNYAGGRTIVNLAAAIGARFGAAPSVSRLAALADPQLGDAIATARCIVLVLLDGVGCAQLETISPRGALASSRLCELGSTFPSSTAPAVTSFATGEAPGTHAVTGWHLWSAAHQAVVRPLPLDYWGLPGQVDAASLFHWLPISARIEAMMTVLQPAPIVDSPYTRHAFAGARRLGYSGFDELRRLIVATAGQIHPRGHYVCAYLPQYDTTAHEFGCASVQAAQVVSAFDTLFADLVTELGGTGALLIATADHGFIDVPPEQLLRIEDFPALGAMLETPLTGEPRVAFCHVRPGLEHAFPDAVAESLGRSFDCFESEQLIRAGSLGPPECIAATLRERLGTHALIGRDRFCLTQTPPGEDPHRFIGMHGGVHRDEIRVGVSVARGGAALRAAPQLDD